MACTLLWLSTNVPASAEGPFRPSLLKRFKHDFRNTSGPQVNQGMPCRSEGMTKIAKNIVIEPIEGLQPWTLPGDAGVGLAMLVEMAEEVEAEIGPHPEVSLWIRRCHEMAADLSEDEQDDFHGWTR